VGGKVGRKKSLRDLANRRVVVLSAIAKEKLMRSRIWMTVVAAVLVCLALPALSQQQPGGKGQPGGPGGQGGGRGGFGGGGFGGGGFGGGAGLLGLLRVPEVQKELELVDEQMTAIAKLQEEARAAFGGGRGGQGGNTPGGQKGRTKGNNNGASLQTAPAEWFFVQQAQPGQNQQGQKGRGGFQITDEQRAEFQKQRAEQKAKLAEILLPHQMKRLTEIYIQQLGTRALDEEDIAKELNVTEAQKSQIAKIREDGSAARRELFAGGGGQSDAEREANRTKMEQMRKADDEKILGLLTADQKTKLEDLKGKPFAMPEAPPGGRGGPGGQKGGPGGQKGAPGGTRPKN
jgi:hypothetical protein